jgi:hypothetical protein
VNGTQRLGSPEFWLENWEKQAIVEFHLKSPLEGYRRLTFVVRCGHRGGETLQRVASAQSRRSLVEVERKAVEEGHGLRAAIGHVSAVAHRCFLSQHYCSGTFYCLCSILVPVHRQLGRPRIDDRGGYQDHIAGS